MSTPAQVRSVEAIELFRAQLATYEQRVQSALETLTAEMQRAADWLQHDRPHHWKVQTKRAEDAVQQAKLDLERCLIFPVAGEQPACREEKSVLRQARQRVDYCREKAERVRHWRQQMHHEMFEYQGRVGQLKRILETELPAARATLAKIVRHLDAYQVERPQAVREIPTTLHNTEPNPTGEK